MRKNTKKTVTVLISVLVVCFVVFSVCLLFTALRVPSAKGKLTVTSVSSAVNDSVSMRATDYDLDGARPYIELLWENRGDCDITYGEMCDIEFWNGTEWQSCVKEGYAFSAIGYLLDKTGPLGLSRAKQTVSLLPFDLSKNGIYRMSCNISAKEGYHNPTTHTVSFEFILK